MRAWVRGALQLEAGAEATVPTTPGPAPTDADLVEAVRRHRVAEVLAPHTLELGIPAPVADVIAQFRIAGRRALAVQILEIGRVDQILRADGLDHLFFKGPALAVQSAGDPTARGPGDIDLLVAPEQVEEAGRLLLEHGWTPRPSSELPAGTWARRYALRSFNSLTYQGRGSTVDLHWRLDTTLHGLPPFAAVWAAREEVDLGGGVRVATLSSGDAMAHSCLHCARDSWRWVRSLVDVHRLAGRPQTWTALEARRPGRVEAATLAVTRTLIGLPAGVPDDVLARIDRVPASVIDRACAAQEAPAHAVDSFPGAHTVRQVRYLVAASPTPRDLAHTALVLALPAQSVVGVEARTAWAGVPTALWRRLRGAARRLAAWTRR